MQTVIYADLLIIFNTVMTLLIIIITSDILKIDSTKVRYLSGAICGGLCSLIILAPEMNIIIMLISKAVMCIIIVILAFGIRKFSIFLKCTAMFIIVSCMLAGIINVVATMINHQDVYMNNGYLYMDINVFVMIAIVCIVYMLIKILNKKVFVKQKGDLIFDVCLEFSGRKIKLKALYDSGNNLIDVFTGKPVIIVSISQLRDCFESEILSALDMLMSGNISCAIPEKIRLLPIRTLGNECVLPAFTADIATVQNDSLKKIIKFPCVAISPDSFDGTKYTGLINDAVLGQVL